MPSVSVLIPIYNVSEYLSKCLDSVICQNIPELEIICINDGSTDGCGKVLDEYKRKHPEIMVITKPNTGYGHSMNVGLEAATGEYIGIVESDDTVEPDFFEKLYLRAKENNLDIIKGECKFVWPSENYSYELHLAHLRNYFNKVISRERLWLRCQFLMNIWTGIYKREFIENYKIRFNETPGASYQDNGFWMQSMIYADRVMFTEDNGYLYRQDNASASVKNPNKIYNMVDEYEWLADHLQGKVSQREMDVVNAFRLIRGYWSFYRIDDAKKREFCDRLISDYIKYGSVFTTDLTWQEQYYQILEDPDEYCRKVINTKKEIESRINEAKSLIIYGAGSRGQKLFRLFCDRGFRSKLQCFVESRTPDKTVIASVPVKQINDATIDWSDALVVISSADGSKMAKEMSGKCNEMAITNLLGSDGFFNSYYTLT